MPYYIINMSIVPQSPTYIVYKQLQLFFFIKFKYFSSIFGLEFIPGQARGCGSLAMPGIISVCTILQIPTYGLQTIQVLFLCQVQIFQLCFRVGVYPWPGEGWGSLALPEHRTEALGAGLGHTSLASSPAPLPMGPVSSRRKRTALPMVTSSPPKVAFTR